MIRRTAIVPLVSVSFLGSCTPPGDLVVGPGARLEPPVSSSLFTAAVEHLARDARGRLLVDPRPLRPGADLSGVDAEDLAPGAEDVTHARAAALAMRGIDQTDATLDQRCTFSEQTPLPPEWEARLSDSTRQRRAECGARPPYTTLILSLPVPATGDGYPPGTWHVEAFSMTKAGFAIWDLYLYARRPGQWEIFASEQRFVIWS